MEITRKVSYIFMLFFILVLQGCSFLGIELGVHRTVVLERSPVRVILSGDIQTEDYVFAKKVLNDLYNKQYIDHNFTEVMVKVFAGQKTTHLLSKPEDKTETNAQ